MSIFDSLSGGNQQQGKTQVTAQEAMSQLQNNPAATLRHIGLNIPAGMNNPQQIVQHLTQTGQVPQSRLAQAMQMMGQLMGRR